MRVTSLIQIWTILIVINGCTQPTECNCERFVRSKADVLNNFENISISENKDIKLVQFHFENTTPISRKIRRFNSESWMTIDLGKDLSYREFVLIKRHMNSDVRRMDSAELYLKKYVWEKLLKTSEYGLTAISCNYFDSAPEVFVTCDGARYYYFGSCGSDISILNDLKKIDESWYVKQFKN